MNTIKRSSSTMLAAASAAAALALAGSAQAQMVSGASGFNLGYNNSGIEANFGYNHLPDQENGPVNVQSTDLNAPNLATGAGLVMSPAGTSVFANSSGVSGALDTFAGAGSSSNITNISVDTSNGSSGGSSNTSNGN
jgi:hypothetical protein